MTQLVSKANWVLLEFTSLCLYKHYAMQDKYFMK